MVLRFQHGLFQRRYKRFFAEVICGETGECLTLHCPNTGAMTGLLQPYAPALFSLASPEARLKRKTPGTLEALQVSGPQKNSKCWVGVNTHRANQRARQWLHFQGRQLFNMVHLMEEVPLQRLLNDQQKCSLSAPLTSRVDFAIQREIEPMLLIEVKSATLLEEDGKGYFPDAPSVRAQRQLAELMQMKASGFDVLVLYVSQHEAIANVEAAGHIDGAYSQLVDQAKSVGISFQTLPFERAFYGLA